MTQWQSSDDVWVLLYSICIIHAVMLTRNCYGWHGNSKWYTIHETTLHHTMQYVMSGSELMLNACSPPCSIVFEVFLIITVLI